MLGGLPFVLSLDQQLSKPQVCCESTERKTGGAYLYSLGSTSCSAIRLCDQSQSFSD